ncbi:VOC family protein [Lampropedia puyangensis]|uniref:2-oxoadipate dioxygenase/decarboxylase n=1 Tax=Lampropedia puyangensis TaxID=1330072 RepID=A0A4S8FD41_9BURK|nr:VOC family protein [Lampropedia puyangensis]THU05219.1 VOC family protein [Lampropedia puyangensis]
MTTSSFASSDEIHSRFSRAMSEMCRQEVHQYGVLLELVHDINAAVLLADSDQHEALECHGELARLNIERHSAIRVGTADELSNIRRVFRVMGMHPVGYYDLAAASVPGHSTAFRPVDDDILHIKPFRIFTSLLRPELIEDEALHGNAAAILELSDIFPTQVLSVVARTERQGGLPEADADAFMHGVTETLRWYNKVTVDEKIYHQLRSVHRLITDVVCFKGPHINHLTPRTLDIDAVQMEMPQQGIRTKDVIEGPAKRIHQILLRQTSFKEMEEHITFVGSNDHAGSHTAHFGEIEQLGIALTRPSRQLYDELPSQVREIDGEGNISSDYSERVKTVSADFPDDLTELYERGLAFFRYEQRDQKPFAAAAKDGSPWNIRTLVQSSSVAITPIIYENFLPVSATGISQSNFGGAKQKSYSAKATFEAQPGTYVLDEIELYEAAQSHSEEVLRLRYMAEVQA